MQRIRESNSKSHWARPYTRPFVAITWHNRIKPRKNGPRQQLCSNGWFTVPYLKDFLFLINTVSFLIIYLFICLLPVLILAIYFFLDMNRAGEYLPEIRKLASKVQGTWTVVRVYSFPPLFVSFYLFFSDFSHHNNY
jgi:hypothetical protein